MLVLEVNIFSHEVIKIIGLEQAHVIQVQKYRTKWESFRFALLAWNLFTQENESRA